MKLLGVAAANGGTDIGSILGSIATGGVLMAIIGAIKKAFSK